MGGDHIATKASLRGRRICLCWEKAGKEEMMMASMSRWGNRKEVREVRGEIREKNRGQILVCTHSPLITEERSGPPERWKFTRWG